MAESAGGCRLSHPLFRLPVCEIPTGGEKDLLGLRISDTEGAKFWLGVFTDLRQGGVQDCFIACVDGLKGLPEGLETVFPHIQVQLCLVHKVRQSLGYVIREVRRLVARDLPAIYGAATLQEAERACEVMATTWDGKYPTISASWRRDWERLTVFFGYPPEIRKVMRLNRSIIRYGTCSKAEAPFPPTNRS